MFMPTRAHVLCLSLMRRAHLWRDDAALGEVKPAFGVEEDDPSLALADDLVGFSDGINVCWTVIVCAVCCSFWFVPALVA